MIYMLPSNNAYDKNQQVKNVKYKEFVSLKFRWSLSQHRTGQNDSNFHVFESIVFPHYLSSYQIESYNCLLIHNRDGKCFLENLCLSARRFVCLGAFVGSMTHAKFFFFFFFSALPFTNLSYTFHLTLTTTLWGRQHRYYFHLTDEESESWSN